jgi:hypothetical protein
MNYIHDPISKAAWKEKNFMEIREILLTALLETSLDISIGSLKIELST